MNGRRELSPSRARRRAKGRRREEKRWADMAGPVTIRKREDHVMRDEAEDEPGEKT